MPSKSPHELLEAATAVAANAYAPYSHFCVGAALETTDGMIFSGCNVENASYGLTICAERNAIFAMVAAGQTGIAQLAIVVDSESAAWPYPCGACRQVINQFAEPDCPIYVAPSRQLDAFETMTLGELLPKSFKF